MKARNGIPMYEGDGFIHTDSTTAVIQRWEAAAEMVGKFFAQAREKFQSLRTSALDDYLARASSLADIERRLREAEREGRFFPG